MRFPNEANLKHQGLYIAVLRGERGDYVMPFEFGGDHHESAWRYAERTNLFQDPIVSVIAGYKFGTNKQAEKFFASKAVNRGQFI